MGHKGASEQIMLQSPRHTQGAYQKEKGMETWKSSKPKRVLTYNDSAPQNRGGPSSLWFCFRGEETP